MYESENRNYSLVEQNRFPQLYSLHGLYSESETETPGFWESCRLQYITTKRDRFPQIYMAYKMKARTETKTPVYYDGSTTYH